MGRDLDIRTKAICDMWWGSGRELWAFCNGGSPRRRSPTRTRRTSFVSLRGVGGVGLGGGIGRWWWKPPPLPPLLAVAHPTPSHAPLQPLILRPRKPHLLHPGPLVGPEVTRRHANTAHHTQRLPVKETPQESKPKGGSPATMRWRDPRVLLGIPQSLAKPPRWDGHVSR